MSFGISVEGLTWDAVSKLEKDGDYWVTCERQPRLQLQGAAGSLTYKSDEKSYRVTVMYALKGHELLVAEMRCDDKATDFDSKQLVDLSKCSMMTEILLEELAPALIWPPGPRSRVWGERFFREARHDFDDVPYQPAFDLEFPKRRSLYAWRESMKFSQRIKRRIFEARAQAAILR